MINATKRITNAALLAGLLAVSGASLAERTAGDRIDDGTLFTNVKFHLVDARGVPAGRINVEVYKGVVSLAGFVSSEDERELTIGAVKGLDGVEKVVDAMVVMPGKRSFGRTIDDQTIHRTVGAKLLDEEGLSSSAKITVKVREGEVLLGGFANSEDLRERAASIAASVNGVSNVHNRIAIQS